MDMPEFKVPAKGIVEWTDITVPSPFKEDTWITSMEILPDHPEVIHHIGVLFRPHTQDVQYDKPEWAIIPRDESGSAYPRRKGEKAPFAGSATQRQGAITIEASYVAAEAVAEQIAETAEDGQYLTPPCIELD